MLVRTRSKSWISYLMIPVGMVLCFVSCGDTNDQAAGVETNARAYTNIHVGLGNIIRNGFDEIEEEVSIAATNEGGVVDSARFERFIERHLLRIEGLETLKQRISELSPDERELKVHHECINLMEAIDELHAKHFTVIIDYLERGLDRAADAKVNPFAVLAQKRLSLETSLTRLEGQIKYLKR